MQITAHERRDRPASRCFSLLVVPLPLAHGGHWTAQLIYLAPLALLGAGLLRSWWKDRRKPNAGPRRPRT